MQVRIVLDHPHAVWTNLDFIKGKVQLSVPSLTGNIISIVVKVEGESRTRLLPPASNNPDENVKHRLEVHKILYKVAQVFPSQQAIQDGLPPRGPYILSSGQYEYPFEFKLPFNNNCLATPIRPPSLKVLVSDVPRSPANHVRRTLPPSLNGFPFMADISYYVKVTVNRKEFYKENPRHIVHFNFVPIEPPRPPHTGAETYARRQHQFPPGAGKQGLFGDLNKPSSGKTPVVEAPSISVDARLPNPAILTCNGNLPLRILVKRLNNSTEPIFLESLHIQLIGYTVMTAYDVKETKDIVWVIASHANMGILLGTAEGNVLGSDLVVDSKPWSNKTLHNSVVPTFSTCNISRRYDLEVKVGIGYGQASSKNATVFPLLLPVQIFSGIEPPASLLAAMANSNRPKPQKPPLSTSQLPGLDTSQTSSSPTTYFTPTSPVAGSTSINPVPLPPRRPSQQQAQIFHPQPTGPDEPTQALVEDPPPSYEDAIAQDLPPVDGPRRDYGSSTPRENGEESFEIDVGKPGRRPRG